MELFKIGVLLLVLAPSIMANGITEMATNKLLVYENHTKDVEQIVKSVKQLGVPDDISCLSVYGPHAFAIVAAPGQIKGEIFFNPIIATGTYGKGRIIGFGSKTMVVAKWGNSENNSNNRQIILRAINWARQSVASTIKNKQIGFFGSCCKELKTFFSDKKLKFSEIKLRDLRNYTQLSKFDVIINVQNKNDKYVEILLDYVNYGGILFLGQSARDVNSESHFGSTFPANMISSHAGFVWTNGKAGAVKGDIQTNIRNLENTHFSQAWELISKLPKPMNARERQAWKTVEAALAFAPPTDTFWVSSFNFTSTLQNLLTRALFS